MSDAFFVTVCVGSAEPWDYGVEGIGIWYGNWGIFRGFWVKDERELEGFG